MEEGAFLVEVQMGVLQSRFSPIVATTHVGKERQA